jgi:hypothetical protein
MKRYIFPLVLVLMVAVAFFAMAAVDCWDIISTGIEAANPKAVQQQKAAYTTALHSTALDPKQVIDWKAQKVAWPKGTVQDSAPDGFVEKYRYVTPDGFPILSNTANWKTDKLKSVYTELIKNKHGHEITSLNAIYICSKAIKFKDDAAGQYVQAANTVKLSIRLPGLMAEAAAYATSAKSRTIWIAEPGGKGTAQQIAYTLSHEYGHFFHDMNNSTGGVLDRKFTADQQKLLGSSYIWLKEEIEANDYVTLMGSPDSFEKAPVLDVKQRLASDIKAGNFKKEFYDKPSQIFALLDPLAFTLLSPASQVKGLSASYYKFLPTPPTPPAIPTKIPKLSIKGKGKTYTVSWTKPWTDKKTYYVLLCSSDEVDPRLDGTPFEGNSWHQFICTRWGNEKASATIGKVSQRKGNTMYWYDDGIPKGTKTFRVFAVLPGNMVVESDPLKFTFK